MYETELINSVLKGNQQDYGLLIKKYQTNVFRTAIGFVNNKEDAEEITQDVFIKAYQSLSSFGGKAAFSTWLYRITVNTSLNYIRKKKQNGFWTGLTALFQTPSKNKLVSTIIEENAEKAYQTLLRLGFKAKRISKNNRHCWHWIGYSSDFFDGALGRWKDRRNFKIQIN